MKKKLDKVYKYECFYSNICVQQITWYNGVFGNTGILIALVSIRGIRGNSEATICNTATTFTQNNLQTGSNGSNCASLDMIYYMLTGLQ